MDAGDSDPDFHDPMPRVGRIVSLATIWMLAPCPLVVMPVLLSFEAYWSFGEPLAWG